MALQQEQTLIDDLNGNLATRQVAEKNLYYQYQYFIDEGCRKYALSEQDSFSAYSDAIISVIRNIRLQKFDGRSSLKTYLYQVFSNKCVDLLRHRTTNKEQANRAIPVDELMLQLPDAGRNIIEDIMTRQQLETTRQKLAELGDKCREILLFFEDGLSDKQIAEEMAYQNAAVVKTTRLRCLEKLREKVLAAFRGS